MSESLIAKLQAAEEFVEDNLVDLCVELDNAKKSDYSHAKKLHHLRSMNLFATSSALSLSIKMVQDAAVRRIAKG